MHIQYIYKYLTITVGLKIQPQDVGCACSWWHGRCGQLCSVLALVLLRSYASTRDSTEGAGTGYSDGIWHQHSLLRPFLSVWRDLVHGCVAIYEGQNDSILTCNQHLVPVPQAPYKQGAVLAIFHACTYCIVGNFRGFAGSRGPQRNFFAVILFAFQCQATTPTTSVAREILVHGSFSKFKFLR